MKTYTFNYSKLKGKIREKYNLQRNFARDLGIAPATLSGKLNNITDFSQSEIMSALNILEINGSEVFDFFFTHSSEKLNNQKE